MFPRKMFVFLVAAFALLASSSSGQGSFRPVPPTAVKADSLIRPGETHFLHLWQLTFGGQNAEAYWSHDGRKLIWQTPAGGHPCDMQFVMDLETGERSQVSPPGGRTTCGYFYDGDRRVLFASTHAAGDSCPPEPDRSHGYVWPLYRSYDIWTANVDGTDLRRLTDHDGYDAEGTVSVDGNWLVFTSAREGDVDLYKMRLDGSRLQRLTNKLGYDGGAFFSHDGRRIVWRTFRTTDSTANASFQELLGRELVKPSRMDLWIMDSDGKNQRQITFGPGASFAPYFTPDDKDVLYASNRLDPRGRNFDLWLVSVGGGRPRQVTTDPDFDGFPMFSPDGRWLLFCSNRNGRVPGETNVFLAEWRR